MSASSRSAPTPLDDPEVLATFVARLADAIYVTTADGELLAGNPAFLELFAADSLEALRMRPVAELIADPERRAVQRRLLAESSGSLADFELQIRRLDGELRTVLDTCYLHRDQDGRETYHGILRDVTEERRTALELHRQEERLYQAQKMDAVGRLAGGVAHDFNNVLTSIAGNAELVLATLPAEATVRDQIAEIQRAALHAAELTGRLLAFSRGQRLTPRELCVHEILDGLGDIIASLVGEGIELDEERGPELPPVYVDPGKLAQVILNLVLNARDAMPGGGRLTLSTRHAQLTTGVAAIAGCVPAGDWVVLEVADSGVGIDAGIRERIFEPFYTTREDGTGLGLSTVRGIVEQSGGHIAVVSEPSAGSRFTVFLPVAAAAKGREPEESPARGGGELILLVEDEEPVRRLTADILEHFGYKVLTAACADEALEVADDCAHVDLLLTDVVMPGKSGPRLAAGCLRRRRGDLPVLFISGWAEDTLTHRGLLPGDAFLAKPYTPRELARKIREVFDARKPA